MTTHLMTKYIYELGDGNASMKNLLGGKGANLCEMAKNGLPIPEAVIITTEACAKFNENTAEGIEFAFDLAEKIAPMFEGRLVSVRSGARVSMPGMMDTILNVGLSDSEMGYFLEKLGHRTGWDSYRRLYQMFGEVVEGIPASKFSEALAKAKSYKYDLPEPPATDADMSVAHLTTAVTLFKKVYEAEGASLPSTLVSQLALSIIAVFKSWNSERAIAYRRVHGYPDDWGTAVIVQEMVFGNMNDNSCSGVLFSRDPSTGANKVTGEFLQNAQGEDVVAGTRTPLPIVNMPLWNPEIAGELWVLATKMERHYKDMQDMEFTVQDGELFILQTRSGKRSSKAAFVIAHGLEKDGYITKEEAVRRVTGKQFTQLTAPAIDSTFDVEPDGIGIAASAGIASGIAVFSKEAAEACPVDCILVSEETTPDDFPGMIASVGILTSTGGSTSHAAVVARGMDKACVVGLTALEIQGTIAGIDGVLKFEEGDMITIDGATGRVWFGVDVPVVTPTVIDEAKAILEWAGLEDQSVNMINSVASAEAMMPNEGVFIDAVALGLESFRKVLDIAKEKNFHGVIDLLGETSIDDLEFMETFEITSKVHAAPSSIKMRVDPDRFVVNCGEDRRKEFEPAGFQCVGIVKDLGEFLKAQGVVDFSPEFLGFLEEQNVKSVDEFLALKSGSARRLQRGLPKERLIFELLGDTE